MPLAITDWTQIAVACIAAAGAIASAIIAGMNRRDLRTPSGATIGRLTELGHDLSAVDVALSLAVLEKAGGDVTEARAMLDSVLGGETHAVLHAATDAANGQRAE